MNITQRRYQPTYHDAIRLARHEMMQLGIEPADDHEELHIANQLAYVWFEEISASHFRRALEAAGLLPVGGVR